MPTSLPPPRPPGTEAKPPDDKDQRVQGLQGTMLVVTLGLLIAMVAIPLFHPGGRPARSVRVVIAPPLIDGSLLGTSDSDKDLLLEALDDAIERALASRLGISAVRPKPGDPTHPQELASKWQADEVLAVKIKCLNKLCRGNLARLRSLDGKAKWQRRDFLIPTDNLRQLEQELAKEVAVAYTSFPAIQGAGKLFVEADDYRTYLRLRRRHRQGSLGGDVQRQLSRIHTNSPRFLEAYVMSAELALSSSQGDREEARAYLSQARRIAPLDSRVLELSIPLLLADGQFDDVRSTLVELRNQWPDAARLEVWQEQLEAAEVGSPSVATSSSSD